MKSNRVKLHGPVAARSPAGLAVTVLNIFIAVVVAAISVAIAYEMARLTLARAQLKTCVEAAALAGEITLISGDLPLNTSISQELRRRAEDAALSIFRKNTILGQQMNNVTRSAGSGELAPAVDQAELSFDYLDPITNVPEKGPANVLRVTGAYNFPIFPGFFLGAGASSYTIVVSATTSLPPLDLVIVFDLSQSLDDQTNVTFVNRHWDGGAVPGETVYDILGSGSGHAKAEGTIQKLVCAPPMGSKVNALPGQNLEAAMDASDSCAKYFSEAFQATRGLRGSFDNGKPPGDCPVSLGGVAGYGDGHSDRNSEGKGRSAATKGLPKEDDLKPERKSSEDNTLAVRSTLPARAGVFTDLAVNLDGRPVFGGCTSMGYQFPTIATLVEASRSNLDSMAMSSGARVPLKTKKIPITPKAGYQSAYVLLAARLLEPLRTVEMAQTDFMTRLLQRTDCHFGFVGFSDRAGTAPDDSVEAYTVSPAYKVAGVTDLPLPLVKLKAVPGSSNYKSIVSLINPPDVYVNPSPPCVLPIGGTNIAAGLKTALDELTDTGARPGAAKAVLLITDGTATRDLLAKSELVPPHNEAACRDARDQAKRAYHLGIPIFVLALDQAGEPMSSWQDSLFNDADGSFFTGGIAAISGHGARFYQADWVSPAQTRKALGDIFDNIVSQLTLHLE